MNLNLFQIRKYFQFTFTVSSLSQKNWPWWRGEALSYLGGLGPDCGLIFWIVVVGVSLTLLMKQAELI